MSSVLITGTTRGIGKQILAQYLSKPGRTVISAVRNLNAPSVADLRMLPVAANTRLILVQIDSQIPAEAEQAANELRALGITSIDTIVANAGVGRIWEKIAKTPASEVEYHLNTNATGPFTLYLAMRSLLLASPNPKFVVISTELGSIGLMKGIPDVAYGMSKAAVNFFVAKLHAEEPKLIAFPIHPGWVKTELGNAIATTIGMTSASITEEESAVGVIEQIENATREKSSGKFFDYKGNPIPW